MEHFTQSVTDDFADYNGNREPTMNGVSENGSTREGEAQSGTKEIDVDAILNRAPIWRHRRSRPLEEAPEFVQRLSAFAEVRAGEDVVFACQWRAFPLPSVRWYRDDADITDDATSDANARLERDSADDGTETLIVRRVGKKDEGAYKCRVENREGVAATTGYLSVTGDIAEKSLSQVHKKNKSEHSISSAPHLRTIVEQKSVEEREAEKAQGQDPSPIQTFIDNFRREKTWPMYGTGYNDDALSTGSTADLSSLSSEPTTPDVEDYESVSFTARQSDDTPAPHTLSVPQDALIKAPSIEDIMGEIEAREKEGEFDDIPLKCQNEKEYDSTEEDTCPTPTNFLDEPEFPASPEAEAEVPEPAVQQQPTPAAQPAKTEKKKLVRSSNTFDAGDELPVETQQVEMNPKQTDNVELKIETQQSPVQRESLTLKIESPDPVPVQMEAPEQQESPKPNVVSQDPAPVERKSPKLTIESQEPVPVQRESLKLNIESQDPAPVQRESPRLEIDSQAERRARRRKSPSPMIELREIPIVASNILAEQLELPWIYYFLFCSCCASFAAATELPVPYLVAFVALVSLISFRYLHHQL